MKLIIKIMNLFSLDLVQHYDILLMNTLNDTLEGRAFKEFAGRYKLNLQFLQFMNFVCEHKMQKYSHIHC